MLMPVGDTAAVNTVSCVPLSVSIDHEGIRTASMPRPWLSRVTAVCVIEVDWPLANKSAAAASRLPCRSSDVIKRR